MGGRPGPCHLGSQKGATDVASGTAAAVGEGPAVAEAFQRALRHARPGPGWPAAPDPGGQRRYRVRPPARLRRHRTSFGEFQERVPIATYEDLEPYITAQMHGRPNQLTKEPPVLFTTTSGTTGNRKYIPMTHEGKRAKSHLTWLWFCGMYRDHPGIVGGRILSVVSPEVESHAPSGVPCGAESGHAYRTMPGPVKLDVHRPLRGVRHRGLRGQVLHAAAAGRRPGHQLHRHRQPQHRPAARRPAGTAHRVDHSGRPRRDALLRVLGAPGSSRRSAPATGPRARQASGTGGGRRRRPAAARAGLARAGRDRLLEGWDGRRLPGEVRHLVPTAAAGQGLRLLRHRAARLGPAQRPGRRRDHRDRHQRARVPPRRRGPRPRGPGAAAGRAAGGRAAVFRLRDQRLGPVSLRDERHRRGGRTLREDAADPVHPEGQGGCLVHRREALRGPDHRRRRQGAGGAPGPLPLHRGRRRAGGRHQPPPDLPDRVRRPDRRPRRFGAGGPHRHGPWGPERRVPRPSGSRSATAPR